MRIALTGASGFIGSAIARRLVAAGHRVTALVRPTSGIDHIRPCLDRIVFGDQADETAWPKLFDGADCVIHDSADWQALEAGLDPHLPTNLLGSIRLLAASRPRQFIFISTIAVHHDMRPRWGGVIDEDHPLRPNSIYGAYKAAVESHLWAEHYEYHRHTSALRPCGVYGMDPRIDRCYGYNLIGKLRRSEPFDRSGGGKFIHVDDVAAAAVAAIDNPGAAGKPFNLVDCYARWGDLAVMAADLLGIRDSARIDLSSPPHPKNTFSKDAVRSILGVNPDRGHPGLREHLQQLIKRMSAT